jgi:hypothetical protein
MFGRGAGEATLTASQPELTEQTGSSWFWRSQDVTRLLLAKFPGQFVAAHFRPAWQVAPLGDLVQLSPGFRGTATDPLAPGDCGALLAQCAPGLLGQVRDRLLTGCGLLGLFTLLLAACVCLLVAMLLSSVPVSPRVLPGRRGG